MKEEETWTVQVVQGTKVVNLPCHSYMGGALDYARTLQFYWGSEVDRITLTVSRVLKDYCPCAGYHLTAIASWDWKKKEGTREDCEPNCSYCRFMRGG